MSWVEALGHRKFKIFAFPTVTITELKRKQTCQPDPGKDWDERRDVTCTTIWPPVRSGHEMLYVDDRLYTFGGYRAMFPYPYSTSSGALGGIQARGAPRTAHHAPLGPRPRRGNALALCCELKHGQMWK